jgi:hypothetical protein
LIGHWRRGIRSRRKPDAGGGAASPRVGATLYSILSNASDAALRESRAALFPRKSLAERVESVRQEIFHKAKVLQRLDGCIQLDKLIEMILPEPPDHPEEG